MKVLQDLNFIKSAIEMLVDALRDDDLKLAEACIQAIQNYLNSVHHPLGFFSTASLPEENFN